MASERCSSIDMNGRQCRATKDLERVKYHGDNELYSAFEPKWPQWVPRLRSGVRSLPPKFPPR